MPRLPSGVLLWLAFVIFLSKPLDLLCGCGGIMPAAILGLITVGVASCMLLLRG